MMLLAAIFIGVGFGNFQSAVQSTTSQMIPADRLTQATATYFIAYEASLGFGPSIIGLFEPYLWLPSSLYGDGCDYGNRLGHLSLGTRPSCKIMSL